MADRQQREIEYDRAWQGATIQRAQLVKRTARDGVGVGPAAQKAVLRAIDEIRHGRSCWVEFERLAKYANLSLRQTKRAVEVMEPAGLITIQKEKQRRGSYVTEVNRYTIIWSELALLRDDRSAPAAAVDRSAFTTKPECLHDQTGVPSRPNRSAFTTKPECLEGTPKANIKANRKAPPPNPSVVSCDLEVGASRWGEVEVELRRCGIASIGEALAGADDRTDPERVLGLIAHWRELRRRVEWNHPPLVLRSRVERDHRELPIEAGWPQGKPSRAWQQRQQAQRDRERLQAEQHAAEATDASEAEFESLSRRYGPVVDRMRPEEIEAHLARGSPFLVNFFRKRGPGGLVREELIRLLAKQEAPV